MLMRAWVIDKETKENKNIYHDYKSKTEYAAECRRNGYIVKGIYNAKDEYALKHSNYNSWADFVKYHYDGDRDAANRDFKESEKMTEKGII